MLHITVAAARSVDPATDALGRSRTGYADDMSPLEIFDGGRGLWSLGHRADRERHGLISQGGITRCAFNIAGLERVDESNKAIIHGCVLRPGDPIYDAYMGKPAPVVGVRNPITYVDSPFDATNCKCGCGRSVVGSDFIPGHDQTALHARVKQIGTVTEFIDWFDTVRHQSAA